MVQYSTNYIILNLKTIIYHCIQKNNIEGASSFYYIILVFKQGNKYINFYNDAFLLKILAEVFQLLCAYSFFSNFSIFLTAFITCKKKQPKNYIKTIETKFW